MSQSRPDEEESGSEEKCHQELEEEDKVPVLDAEGSSSSPPVDPQTPSTEQLPKQENWLWGWLPFPLLSGLTWLGDRNRTLQEPVCSQLEKNRSSGKMCPECEILFCKKCETLHYSPAFIEHGLLGHSAENLPEALSPTLSAGSIELAAPLEETEEEIKK